MDKKLTESKEMYLKAICHLSQTEGSTRSVNIADYLSVSKPSVSHAINVLSHDGLIYKDVFNRISLTSKGRQNALKVIKKYDVLLYVLVNIIGVDMSVAKTDAGRLEHIVSDETIEKLAERYGLQKLCFENC